MRKKRWLCRRGLHSWCYKTGKCRDCGEVDWLLTDGARYNGLYLYLSRPPKYRKKWLDKHVSE